MFILIANVGAESICAQFFEERADMKSASTAPHRVLNIHFV